MSPNRETPPEQSDDPLSISRLPPDEEESFSAPAPQIEGYQIVEKLGEAGQGQVWRAVQLSTGRQVALKVPRIGLLSSRKSLARFEREVEIAARLRHPSIARIYDSGIYQGLYYYVMDLVEGKHLDQYVKDNGLSQQQILELMRLICEAVQHAHQNGVIHRDLKPSNIIVTQDGHPYLVDFGLAKLLQNDGQAATVSLDGEAAGTPAYMSPEQAAGRAEQVDTRTDVYSLGAILFTLLTGRHPHELSGSHLDILRRITEGEVIPPRRLNRTMDCDLEALVLKTLERDADRRYSSAAGLAEDISRYLEHEPILARPPSKLYRFQKLVRRNKGVFVVAALLAAVLLVAVVISTWQAILARRAERAQTLLRQQAQANEHAMRQIAYASDMSLAQHALAMNDLGGARRLLQDHRPGPGEVDLRGWEWRYLWQECQTDALRELCRYSNAIYSVAYSPDGRMLAVAGFFVRQFVEVWDASEHKRITTLQANEGHLAVFSPHGDLLATNTAGNQIRFWQTGTWDPVDQLTLPGRVRVLKFSSDGTRLACLTDPNELWVWQLAPRVIVYQMRGVRLVGSHIGTLDFSPDGMALAVGDGDHHLRVVDLADGSTRFDIPEAHPEPLTFVAWSPDGSLIASGSGFSGGPIRLWEAASGKPVGAMEGHTGWICELIFSRDGLWLYSASADQTIRIWDVSQRRCLTTLRGSTDEVYGLALSPDGATLASAGKDGTVTFWDASPGPDSELPGVTSRESTGPRRQEQPNPSAPIPASEAQVDRAARRSQPRGEYHLTGIFGAKSPDPGTNAYAVPRPAFRPDSKALAVPRDDAVCLIDLETFQEIERIPGPAPGGILRVAFSPNGSLVAIGSETGVVRVWSCEQHRLLRDLNGHTGPVRSLQFRADGRRLLTIDRTKEAIWWDTLTWQAVHTFLMDSSLQGTTVSPDGRLLVAYTASALHWLNAETGELLATTSGGHRHGIVGITTSDDGSRVASVAEDGTVAIWDPSSFKLMTTFKGHMLGAHGVAFSPDGRRLATGSSGNREIVKLWDLAILRELVALPGEGFVFSFVQFSPDGRWLAARSMEDSLYLWGTPSWEEIEAYEREIDSERSPAVQE